MFQFLIAKCELIAKATNALLLQTPLDTPYPPKNMPPTIESAPWRGVFTTRPHSKKPHPQPNAKMPPPTHSSPSNHSEPQKQPPIHKNTTRLKYVRYGMMVFALVVSLVGIWRYRAVMDDLETFQRAQGILYFSFGYYQHHKNTNARSFLVNSSNDT